MKNAGVILVFISSIFFGLELCRPVKKRICLLEDLCKSLELMHAEMASRPSSLEDLFVYLADFSDGLTAAFYRYVCGNMDMLDCKHFSEIWNSVMKETLTSTLSSDDMHAMESLGSVLGCYELSEQLTAISVCKTRLSCNLQEIRSTYPSNRKLYLGLSCSFGAMLALVLV